MSPLIAALALLVSDAGMPPIDAGPPTISDGGSESWADLDWALTGDFTGLVWVDDRRDLSFLASPSRRVDLWANGWRADGGLIAPYGQLICPSSAQERFSEPRIAATLDGTFVVAWLVETLGQTGRSIRTSVFTSGGLGACNNELVPNDGTPLGSLRLRKSGGQYLATWVTPTEVRGQFIRMPATQTSFSIAPVAVPRVTLAASTMGFLAAWDQAELFWSVSIPLVGSGVPMASPASAFTGQLPITQSTAAGPELRGAFIGGTDTRRLFFGATATAALAMPTPGPPAREHPLLATSIGPNHFVAYETSTANQFAVAEFTPATWHGTPALPAGLEPQAMVNDERRVLLLLGGGTATLTLLQLQPQLTGAPTFITPPTTTLPLPNQLAPSLVSTGTGAWLLGWNEGPRFATVQLTTDTTSVRQPQMRLGFTSLVQIADGSSLALSVTGNSTTNVYRYSVDSGREATPMLTASGEQPKAVVGRQAAAVWTAGTDAITFGTGTPRELSFGGFRLGRCGVWADNSMFIPALANGGELRIIEFKDEPGATPTVHAMGPAQRAVLPCLAARGTDLLVVAEDSFGGSFVAMSSVSDVRADRPTRVLSFPNTGNRLITQPVAAGTTLGWQLAWESTGEFVSEIGGLKLSPEGAVLEAPSLLGVGLDERSPVLSSAPGGAVALSWQHFADLTGNVQVRTQIISPTAVLPDGGVVVPNPEPDAGVDLQPIVYTTCGCQSGALPALAGLALLLLSRRRARPRS